MKDVLLLTPPAPPVPPVSSCSIFYFFLSPRFFIYSTNLFHPTGPCLKSLLPGMVYTSYGAVFPLFRVTSQRCTDSTSEAHLSCMRILKKKNQQQQKRWSGAICTVNRQVKHCSSQSSRHKYELSVWLFIYSSSNFTQPGSGADIE